MKSFLTLSIALLLLCISCKPEPSDAQMEQWKSEIRQAESDFAQMVNKQGIREAFLHFAADDAVLKRGQLISGKAAIADYLKNSNSTDLSWAPDFVDVSKSGDLGYTYGSYVFKYSDSLGNALEDTGIFHTVWKRQSDGSWKYVWD